MADGTYNAKVYRTSSGDTQVVKSGGEISVEGTLDIESGGALEVESGGSATVKSGGTLDLTSATVKTQNVANANVIGGIPVVHRITVADGATGDVDVVLTHKTRVLEVIVVKTAGAGGTGDSLTVKNGATAITDAISLDVADKAVGRAATIDDAQWEVAAGGTLRCTRTKASANNAACEVIVIGIRVP